MSNFRLSATSCFITGNDICLKELQEKTIFLDGPHSFTFMLNSFDIICFTLFISEELMQKTFSTFGNIQEIRVFKDKGYAFVR